MPQNTSQISHNKKYWSIITYDTSLHYWVVFCKYCTTQKVEIPKESAKLLYFEFLVDQKKHQE